MTNIFHRLQLQLPRTLALMLYALVTGHALAEQVDAFIEHVPDGHTLRHPMPLRVQRQGHGFVVSNESANIYGDGDTLQQAIDSAASMLVERYAEMSENEAALGAKLAVELGYMRGYVEVTRFVSEGKQRVIDRLVECQLEGAEPNWDCYGAVPVTQDALVRAIEFVRSVPDGVTPPNDAGMEPDGYMTLEWYVHPRCLMSVSVGATGPIVYASTVGENINFGTFEFVGAWPNDLNEMIEAVNLP